MKITAGFALLLWLAMLSGCARTVLVPVPPRVELNRYGTLGIVEFAANSERALGVQATRQFQERIQAAQPGTRIIELGPREALLAALGARQLDADALRKIGAKHGVGAIFLGELAYAEPSADVRVSDLARLEGRVRAELRGDLSGRLVETGTGASVWSNSAWATRQIGSLSVSADRGVSGGVGRSNARVEMVPALVYELTHDFRPSSVRQPAK